MGADPRSAPPVCHQFCLELLGEKGEGVCVAEELFVVEGIREENTLQLTSSWTCDPHHDVIVQSSSNHCFVYFVATILQCKRHNL